jgi:STE24 endopeptidase
MNIYLLLILLFLLSRYVINLTADILNMKSASPELPSEFKGYYDEKRYKSSQEYLKENTVYDQVQASLSLVITVIFILMGGFQLVDGWARSFGFGNIPTGLIFIGSLILLTQLLNLPFSVYHTFVIEAKYGFNKSTVRTFVLDFIKSLIITAVFGAVLLSVVLWFFETAGGLAWLYAFVLVVVFQLFMMLIAPVVILPLFNKYVPLEEGELKQAVEKLAAEQKFPLKEVYKMDGSRRSTKTNAFFIGFGKFRRIALYDTLIAQHPADEMTAILAHEIGHYKKQHIIKLFLISFAELGIMFYLLNIFLYNEQLAAAFKMEQVSVYASLVLFGFLFSPLKDILDIITGVFSRKYEYEADRFAVDSTHDKRAMTEALKKLSVHNLSNLTPHPLKVFLEYTHPPVLQRIKAINK